MADPTWVIIQCCWIAWVAMAFSTKRTVERGGFLGYRLATLLVFAGCIAMGRLLHLSSRSQLWYTTLTLGVVTVCIVVAGAAITIWARITLGRNWSGEVTFK